MEHSYIKECLTKFGLASFNKIFDILYSDLKSDIVVNGKIVNGFKIKRGVKQGDALSCILFILCMEPLLANIEANRNIKGVSSVAARCELPKIYSYADDVNALIVNDAQGLQELFNEYSRLTNKSGLELNANKTEIMPFASGGYHEQNFSFEYLNERHEIEAKQEIKVNGIFLQQDKDTMKDSNVGQIIARMEKQLRGWSARQMTLMGKILIVKTYGISQAVFLMQSMTHDAVHFKRINEILYKFLWNKRFASAKAPDRIKREIINTSTKLGGYGMLNLLDLDESLKLRALGRLINSKHPFLKLIKNSITHENFFSPKISISLDEVSVQGLNLLMEDRLKLLGHRELESNRKFLEVIKGIRVRAAVDANGRNSIIYFNLRLQNKLKLGQLNGREIDSIKNFINPELHELLKRTHAINVTPSIEPSDDVIFYGSKYYSLSKLTSKEIRTHRKIETPICVYKLGAIATPAEVINWGANLQKLTSIKHRNMMLKVAHGEVYTNLKLFKFRLKDTPRCNQCGQIETLNHKFLQCEYAQQIWRHTTRLTDSIRLSTAPNEDRSNRALGLVVGTNPQLLTIHAEILARIHYLKSNTNYTLHPRYFVKQALNYILQKERSEVFKNLVKDLLEQL